MSLVIPSPSDAELIRRAIAYAERNPNKVMKGNMIQWNPELYQNEWQPEFYTVGRDALLDDSALAPMAIRCEVFLALGKVEVTTMKVFAKYIFFLNDFDVTGSLELNATEASAFIGNNVNVKGDVIYGSKKVLGLEVETREISRSEDAIEFESPVDAGVRLIKEACSQIQEEEKSIVF